ncbi:response regulator transcription factor [Amycolatopsis anabasis]|uniref:response regulator transcription factor n=1 Tax=Amycolatopsis anabasis TaxID=1840409 RepID=UPI001C5516D3|nr:LuxR C-terminal-related transcriptional regulator [Amycolatopsis anabasis]
MAALKTIDDVLAHFQVVGDLAREARTKLAAYQEQPPSEQRRAIRSEPVTSLLDGVNAGFLTPRPAVRLTRRQQQVLELLVQGVSNRRIGRTLHITEQTVKAHLHMIYRKLGATDRTEAVVIALRSSLVPEHLLGGRPAPPPSEAAS